MSAVTERRVYAFRKRYPFSRRLFSV